MDKLRTFNLQNHGYDDYESILMLGHKYDERTYDVAWAILVDFGCSKIHVNLTRLVTGRVDGPF
jgi:GTP cyclohydrolase II